ncbi:hypothetical protein [Hymenobacter chitinivorans]|uniref:hypothetical protein n=1 Tax=Hymenobacter chitinivorans TaxID=89969 RepID=UPI000C244B33|nr:hypothetical protein [Hymenobacter chitinivorans]
MLPATVLVAACQSAPAAAPPQPVPAPALAASPVPPRAAPVAAAKAAEATAVAEDAPADSTSADYATFFVVVADTSRSYPALRRHMLGLSQQYALPIDTLGRYFDARKNQIILPADDEDELYAGEYYPRRFPGHTLSLEYLNEYKDQAGAKTMALVTGIYQQEASADSALAVLRRADQNAFKLTSRIYVGCMH